MSIKFICSCGKHLRARDEMAARRSMCPRCGAPVGVPSMRPTHAGTSVAPLSPQERLRHNRDKPSTEITDGRAGIGSRRIEGALQPAAGAAGSPPPRKPKVRRRRQLEQHWYQCLAYPLLNGKMLACFSLILSLVMTGIVLTVQNSSASLASIHKWYPWVGSASFLALIVACAYSTVECALTSALAGEGAASYLPRWMAADPLKSSLRWLACFLAGPIVPAGLSVYFCIYGGDLKAVDWAIVSELSVAAAGYWFLTIVSANERNRLRDANPLRVAQLVQRLKFRAVVPILIAPALGFAHVLLGFFALTLLHESPFGGWLLLVACCGSALFWAAFLFRLLGVWCFRNPPAEPRP